MLHLVYNDIDYMYYAEGLGFAQINRDLSHAKEKEAAAQQTFTFLGVITTES